MAQSAGMGKAWTAPLAGAALVCLLAADSLHDGLLSMGARLRLETPGLALALAFLALAPPAFYALTLERGKPAPALRHPLAPWLLYALLRACVQVSGGPASPLWAAVPLLLLLVARHAGAVNALGLAALATLLDAFPLWAEVHGEAQAQPWPRALALGLPALGLGLGLLSRDGQAGEAAGAGEARAAFTPPAAGGEGTGDRAPLPAPASPAEPERPAGREARLDRAQDRGRQRMLARAQDRGGEPAPARPAARDAQAGGGALDFDSPLVPVLSGSRPDAAAQLALDLRACLDLAFHGNTGFNALSLWWGDAERVALFHVRLRLGSPAAGGEARPGVGHLGLVLRERRPLNLEPISAAAAAGLPWAEGPYLARAVRILPLSDEGRLIGLLACDKADAEAFSADEAGALDALARLLVQRAQHAAFLQRLEAAGGRTQKLYAAAQALSAGMERESLLARFAELLHALVPSDSWALAMREEEHAALQRIASAGYLADAPQALTLDRSGALAATLAHAEGAVLFNSQPGDQVPAVLLEGLAGNPRHFLLAPLRLGGQLTGVLKLDRSGQPFSEEEREAAFIYASQAAVTLEHARLFTLHRLLATTDGLTGLYNHRHFQDRLAAELEKALRSGRPLSVALTDIDFFKKFNDSFGHQEGDLVLRKVANLVREGVRPGVDIACRYGGEEFAVIMPDCDVVEARQILDALRAHCAAHLSGGNGAETRAINLSVGIATYPAAAREQRDLIHAADEALYKAKHTGRNRVCSFKDL